MAEEAPLTRVEKLALKFAELANDDSRGKWLQTRFLRGVSYVWVRAALANRMSGVPRNQLMMNKLMINSAFDNMGLQTTQMFATLFDGAARHSPEGMWFKERAEEVGFKQAVKERDSGEPIAPGVSR